MKRSLLIFIFFSLSLTGFATHFRAGEITYQRISGNTFRGIVTLYTKESSPATQQQDQITIYWGDGDSSIVNRSNGPDNNSNGIPDGVSLSNDINQSIYIGTHTYPGASGASGYIISVFDRNRNAGIENIPNSVDQAFFIQSVLYINNILGPNNSPTLLNPPIDEACIGKCFIHNPGAFDPDRDSLVYSLVQSFGENGQPIEGYTFPNQKGGGAIAIDQNGDFTWCSPQPGSEGEWNIAILIKEYRKLGNSYYLVGQTLRDMQITVSACSNNPPVIADLPDTCIVAGTTLTFNVTATDPDAGQSITLSATGAPFQASPSATFPNTTGISPVSSTFNWTPGCSSINSQPYLVTFKARDNDPLTPLVDIESINIRVVGPAITGLVALPSGSSMILNWNANACANTVQYKIYRKDACGTWQHGPCETGVPSISGYTLIGTTSSLTFTDNNNGQGLSQGISYSYIVVSVFSDGSESFASAESCALLLKEVPIITNVSVDTTSQTNGKMFIRWEKPDTGPGNFDTTLNVGPYTYTLSRATGFSGGTFSAIANFTSPFFGPATAFVFRDSMLNTQDNPYTYRVDFYANSIFKGSSPTASSVYLNVLPSDNQLSLSWQESVPWSNYLYYIYQETTLDNYILIDSTTAKNYVVDNLVNGVTYCFRILSKGEYSDPSITNPLFNYSEKKCGTPTDLTPPCPPNLVVDRDCDLSNDYLKWNNPNNSCADDVVKYNIYYAAVEGDPYVLLTSIPFANDTDFTFTNPASIAGCFTVSAIDSFNNESARSNSVCVDNCPKYELPNVFTPNGDNNNEFFHPFPYRFVKDIDIRIFDRWGVLMFRTNDPDIKWDGKNKENNKQVPEGVYYYVCIVNEIRLQGIVPREISGFVHVLYGRGSSNN
jgi:gliding motility-associated-like protein